MLKAAIISRMPPVLYAAEPMAMDQVERGHPGYLDLGIRLADRLGLGSCGEFIADRTASASR